MLTKTSFCYLVFCLFQFVRGGVFVVFCLFCFGGRVVEGEEGALAAVSQIH